MAGFDSAHAHNLLPSFCLNDWIKTTQTSPQMKHNFGTFLSAPEVQLYYICAM